MEKYRKDDQFYIDNYDRSTISELKKMEADYIQKGIKLKRKLNFPESVLKMDEFYDPLSIFYERAVSRAKIKNEVIAKQKWNDEKCDRLLAQHRSPDNVKCNICSSRMLPNGQLFKNDNTLLLFVFKCPKGHTPNKVLYPNGDEFFFQKSTCKKCGGEIEATTKKNKNSISFKDKCKVCGDVDAWEIDLTPDKPIDEVERKKYCTDFINKKSIKDDLEDLMKLSAELDEARKAREEKEIYNIDQIEKLTIPQVEQRLTKLTEQLGYIKFQFEKPNFGKHVIVEFAVQDTTDRNAKASENILKKKIPENLLPTSWRLQKQTVSYRLGYITGKLKSYNDDDEGLIKIVKEIKGVM